LVHQKGENCQAGNPSTTAGALTDWAIEPLSHWAIWGIVRLSQGAPLFGEGFLTS
jgi:hypothetical protein